ncbi:unnamed protein product [Pleuronectes platessa]|uniref:Uncharacterized protein n=1 Tax=Pleuronectes platessa TaxID=8262 RepID=A0A9N7UNP9_PLEPL|nr:unnamed protein product [Pleuronectes platessa]
MAKGSALGCGFGEGHPQQKPLPPAACSTGPSHIQFRLGPSQNQSLLRAGGPQLMSLALQRPHGASSSPFSSAGGSRLTSRVFRRRRSSHPRWLQSLLQCLLCAGGCRLTSPVFRRRRSSRSQLQSLLLSPRRRVLAVAILVPASEVPAVPAPVPTPVPVPRPGLRSELLPSAPDRSSGWPPEDLPCLAPDRPPGRPPEPQNSVPERPRLRPPDPQNSVPERPRRRPPEPQDSVPERLRKILSTSRIPSSSSSLPARFGFGAVWYPALEEGSVTV